MNRFFRYFILAASLFAALRLLLSPGVAAAARATLQKLGESETLAAVLLGTETAPAHDAVVSGESALPSFTPDAGPEPVLHTAAPSVAAVTALHSPLSRSGTQLEINNSSSYFIDTESLLSEPLDYTLRVGTPQVLILHTHGSEAYSQEGGAYEESDAYRTSDKKHNVVQVGTVLADALAAHGLTVLHDTELYDYPSYSGSYARSLDAVEEYLRKYSTIKVVIDLHRDASDAADGQPHRSEYIGPDGRTAAQLMIIAATGESGLSMPNWQENMKLALRLQAQMTESYPGLARPLYVSTERYNQHAAPGYLLVEVGSNGNTLAEAENAARLFADCMAKVLGEVIE